MCFHIGVFHDPSLVGVGSLRRVRLGRVVLSPRSPRLHPPPRTLPSSVSGKGDGVSSFEKGKLYKNFVFVFFYFCSEYWSGENVNIFLHFSGGRQENGVDTNPLLVRLTRIVSRLSVNIYVTCGLQSQR